MRKRDLASFLARAYAAYVTRHRSDREQEYLDLLNGLPSKSVREIKAPPPPEEPSNNVASQNNKAHDAHSRRGEDKQLKASLNNSIITEKPNVKWDDVAGLDAAKEELQMASVLPSKFPSLFKDTLKPRRGILLYGPSGTGKSHLAKAVASEVDSTLFSISSSDVMSKWYGESERLVKALFELAREKKPSIIFIDEIDALCSTRDGDSASEHSNRIKTELLVQMDGVGRDNSGILILAATNLPWTLDPAIRRRFQKKIHIPLPEQPGRKRLFEISVRGTPCGLSQGDYLELSRKTEGFSGSDITNLVEDALMQPLRKIQKATHYHQVFRHGQEKLTPCRSRENGAVPMTWRDVPPDKMWAPKVVADDFYSALAKAKPTVGQVEIQKCNKFTIEYGTEGG